jgi:tetratricopeptide (TPR) repeat protein
MPRPSHAKPTPPKTTLWDHAAFAAFLFAMAIVAARALMMEIVREPFDVMPGSPPTPRGCGAAGSLWLDLFACLPAILVIARRAFDRDYSLRPALSFIPLGLLTIWTTTSIAWSSDKFLAAVSAAHVVGAVAVAFAASQLVRSWTRFRIATALGFGLILAYASYGIYYRSLDLPDLQADWKEHRETYLRQHNFDPDTFAAKQFEKKILAGEMVGFFASPNTFAAVVVLCFILCAGLAAHRVSHKDGAASLIPYIIAAGCAGWILYYCRSRTAFATAVLGLMFLAAIRRSRSWLAQNSRAAYAVGVLLVCAITAAVVFYGVARGNLTHFAANSLTFRWKYWVASARMFADHPLHGIGYANFGLYYLRYRLPEAAEEIIDPHNFVVRVFTELGAVGGVLLIAWLLRLAYELTRPLTPVSPGNLTRLRPLIVLVIVAMVINALFSIDWSQSLPYVELELIKRILYYLFLLFGVVFAALRSLENSHADDRPAPWVLYGLLVALLLFALHNSIDFSVFETGPMFLAFFFGGCALGMRSSAPVGRRPRSLFAGLVAVCVIAWIVAAIAFVMPISEAESHARQADDFTRVRKFVAARDELYEAIDLVRYNSAYPMQAARVLTIALAKPDEIRVLLDQAIHLNPQSGQQYFIRAQFELQQPSPNRDQVIKDMNRVIELNPNDVQIRLAYAMILQSFGMAHESAAQLRAALHYNDLLDATEPKRLSEETVEQIRGTLKSLESQPGS